MTSPNHRFCASPPKPSFSGKLFRAVLALVLLTLATSTCAQESSWQPIGPDGGNVISLALSAQNLVYLGTADGHIFAARDGRHWQQRGRVSQRRDAVVQKLLVDTRRENELLAAVWFQDVPMGGGLYRSTDAGATWSDAGLAGEILRTVEQSRSAPDVFVAGTRSGVFRSIDGGQSWERISPLGDPELRNVDSVAIDPRDPKIIYAGTYHLPWKTSDAGKTWTAVAAGMIDDSDVMSLRLDSANPARIFASACSGIYRSENGGALWTKLQGIPYSSRRTQAMTQDPGDARVIYAATTEGLWLTRDGGESWGRVTPRDWVVNDVVVLSARPDNPANDPASDPATVRHSNAILLATEEQGLLLSDDGGLTFTPANQGFHHRISGGLVSDAQDAQHLLAWMPGSPNALLETRDGGANWTPLPNHPSSKLPASSIPVSGLPLPDIARLLSSDSGWWMVSTGGAVFAYQPGDTQWMSWRFVSASAVPARRSQSAARHSTRANPGRAQRQRPPYKPAPAVKPPDTAADVLDLQTVGARVFVATTQGLWTGTLGERILRPVPLASVAVAPVPPEDAHRATATADGRPSDNHSCLHMVAGREVLCSADQGKSWSRRREIFPPRLSAGDVRWVREVPGELATKDAGNGGPFAGCARDASLLLAGTTQGLYRLAPGSETWQLVQSGLPAAEPAAAFFRQGLSVLAMRGGGVYLSRDATQNWERLDVLNHSGRFTGVAILADGNIGVASLTEGMWRVPAASAP